MSLVELSCAYCPGDGLGVIEIVYGSADTDALPAVIDDESGIFTNWNEISFVPVVAYVCVDVNDAVASAVSVVEDDAELPQSITSCSGSAVQPA